MLVYEEMKNKVVVFHKMKNKVVMLFLKIILWKEVGCMNRETCMTLSINKVVVDISTQKNM
jgi:hypothetical protein